MISAPFDIDENSSSFSDAELDRIQHIWERVVEDFAMYNADVTTENPGVEALRRGSCPDCASSYCCGDGACEAEEDSGNCAVDCGSPPACNDGYCDPGEDSCSCAKDCGAPPQSETIVATALIIIVMGRWTVTIQTVNLMTPASAWRKANHADLMTAAARDDVKRGYADNHCLR